MTANAALSRAYRHVCREGAQPLRMFLALLLTVGIVGQIPATPAAAAATAAKPTDVKGIKVTPVVAKPLPEYTAEDRELTEADLPPDPEVPAEEQLVDLTQQASTRVRAGQLPVSVAPAAKLPASQSSAARDGYNTVRKVRVSSLSRSSAEKLGVRGLVVRVGRADGVQQAGQVRLAVDYKAVAGLFSRDALSRLRLVQLSDGRPVPSTNDARSSTVTATVSLAAAGAVSSFAVAAAPEGENGDYKATTLTPASTWQVSQQNGAFAWSYPIKATPPPGGMAPDLKLGYSSAAIDGRTSGNNTQGSWIGDGWSLEPGYIERSYRSCADDKGKQDDNEANNKDVYGDDQCWFNDNATMSFNGASTELVKDAATDSGPGDTNVRYHGVADDGSRIEQVKGVDNGDDDKTYWRVTTVDGTQYYFGRGTTDGGTSSGEQTKSTWTLPVYSNHPDEPGHDKDFAESRVTRAWRWNLDYAVDPNRNTITYFYGKETGAYAREGDEDKRTTYDRSGYLTKVEYGSRSDAAATVSPVNRVVFDTVDRCIGTCRTSSDKPIVKRFPDTPWDQYCDQAPCKTQYSPTFWTNRRLSEIRTQVYSGSGAAYTTVGTYKLAHAYLQAGGNESTPMWLKSITHTGNVTSAGGPAVTDPAVVFNPNADVMPNRVDTPNGHSSLFRSRIETITTESGAQIGVTYSQPECDDITLPEPWANTKRCFPQYYAAEGEDSKIDWFNKYVVTRVDVYDNTGGFDHQQTNYDYLDSPAWAYDNSELVKPKRRTWGQFRGYGRVQIRTGVDDEVQSRTEYRYFRGLDGDPQPTDGELPPKGTPRDVKTEDSLGGKVTDHEAFTGMLREQIDYNGTDWVTGTLNTPVAQGPTASAGPLKAWKTHLETVRKRTKLANGTTRWTKTITKVNDDNLVSEINDLGDEADAGDDRCTRTEYTRDELAWMLDRVKRKVIDGAGCSTASKPEHVLSDIRTYYDNPDTYGAAPTRGLPVRVDQVDRFDGSTPILVTASRTGYDATGRATKQTDALGHVTTTEFTPTIGGPVTQTKNINDLKQTATQTFDPALAVATKVTDANGLVTESSYDGNGRLLAVWAPGRDRATFKTDPSVSYTYNLSKTAPSTVITKNLMPYGSKNYRTTVALYDGMLRLRQTQTQTLAGGRAVADTVYNTRGLVDWTSSPYYDIDNSAPSTTLVTPVRRPEIPAVTANVYDGAGRITDAIFKVNGDEEWRTHTDYAGDKVNVTPPDGGIATTSITDARGNLAELRQYKDPAKVGGDDAATFESTVYRYNNRDELTSVIGPGKNTWTYRYDLRGHKIAQEDPDAGTTTSGYDDAGQLSWTRDARGKTLYFDYDELGRKTAERQGAADGRKLAEWKYDTLPYGVGKQTSATRYEYDQAGNASAYVTATTGYDTAGRPKGTSLTLPSTDSDLCVSGEVNPCTFTQTLGYRPNGTVEKVTTPAVAGLPAETVTTLFNPIGLPNGLIGKQIYAQEIVYNQLDQLIGQNLGEHGARIALTYGYDDATGRQSTFNAVPELKSDVYNLGYRYDDAGTITAITDTPDAGQPAETQCFQYDHLKRLTEAWSQTAATCPDTINSTAIGGPASYGRSYTYDDSGNRKTELIHQTTKTTRTYNYPASGGPAGSKPHAVTSVTATGGSTATLQYAYDATGNTQCRPTGTAANICNKDGTAGTASQALTWNDQGKLSTSTDATGTTSYSYDTTGDRLIRRDPTGTTLYLPGGLEIRKPKTGSAVGTRYYGHAGATIAVRTPTALTWMVNDHQGTATATVTSNTNLTVNWRRTMPFGDDRGTKPSTWAGDKGFVGGTRDNTGLTHLGAREYDPALGRFISVDPIMDLADPQQWNPYSYANNTPISAADPTGLKADCGTGGVHMPCTGGGNTGGKDDDEGDKGGDTGNGGDNGGGSSGGNNGAGSSSGNVAQAVPAVQQKEKCGWFAPVCNGWQRSMEWVHENQDTLGQIAIDLAEIELGLFAMEGGGALAASGGIAIAGSWGSLSVAAAPAVALGVGIAVGGAGAAGHGAKNLGQHIDDLHWSNRATGAGSGSGQSAKPSGAKAVEDGDFDHVRSRHREGGEEQGLDDKAGIFTGKEKDLRKRLAEAVDRGRGRPNTPDPATKEPRPGTVYEWDFGVPVGRAGSGNGGGELTRIAVVVNDGKMVTAYPY
ncbi:RHS repeat-associated core domain-containing protein [Actinoplanes sp. NPDC049599]|uniref:RHS repeat-associated core domain-containing protein n=1 Tax=Actinoplanes sp. NPDC049599 TaxID=3363903 RepID=UPI00378FDD0D